MEQNNKLIAEFMGEDVSTIQQDTWGCKQNELQYHKSWDWLMPVVIKIGGSKNIVGATRILRRFSIMRNLNDTYQAVVEFIKEYNDGKKQ